MDWIRINRKKTVLALLSIIVGFLLGYVAVFIWTRYIKNETPKYQELSPIVISNDYSEPIYDYDHLLRLGYDMSKDTNDLIIKNAGAAVDIAESILYSVTESSVIEKCKPYSVRNVNNDLWEVEGFIQSSKIFHVLISGKTGAVIELLY